jgi:hypothetical protein
VNPPNICHCEPFASAHPERSGAKSKDAQDKLREAIVAREQGLLRRLRLLAMTCSLRLSGKLGEEVEA